MRTKLFLESTQNQRCFNVKFRRWFNVDKLTLFRRWNTVIFSTMIGRFSFFKHDDMRTKLFLESTQINVVSTLKYVDVSTLTNRRWINVDITLTDVATLFQHISTLNQRWVFAGTLLFLSSIFSIIVTNLLICMLCNRNKTTWKLEIW